MRNLDIEITAINMARTEHLTVKKAKEMQAAGQAARAGSAPAVRPYRSRSRVHARSANEATQPPQVAEDSTISAAGEENPSCAVHDQP